MSRSWALCSDCGVENSPEGRSRDGLLVFSCYYCDSGQQISPAAAMSGQGISEPWPLSARTACCDVLVRVVPVRRASVLTLNCPRCPRAHLISERDAAQGGPARLAALAGRCSVCRRATALLPPRWEGSHLSFDCSHCQAPQTIAHAAAEAHGGAALDDIRQA